jgi:hypothetical protein
MLDLLFPHRWPRDLRVGGFMGLAPVPKREAASGVIVDGPKADSADWMKIAAGGALIAGGLLMLSGQRRAAMAAAAAGTALAMLDQQETLRAWWRELPGYVDQLEQLIQQVQSTVDELAAKRNSLRRVLSKAEGES